MIESFGEVFATGYCPKCPRTKDDLIVANLFSRTKDIFFNPFAYCSEQVTNLLVPAIEADADFVFRHLINSLQSLFNQLSATHSSSI